MLCKMLYFKNMIFFIILKCLSGKRKTVQVVSILDFKFFKILKSCKYQSFLVQIKYYKFIIISSKKTKRIGNVILLTTYRYSKRNILYIIKFFWLVCMNFTFPVFIRYDVIPLFWIH